MAALSGQCLSAGELPPMGVPPGSRRVRTVSEPAQTFGQQDSCGICRSLRCLERRTGFISKPARPANGLGCAVTIRPFIFQPMIRPEA